MARTTSIRSVGGGRTIGFHPFKGRDLKTPSVLELFLFYVAIVFSLGFALFPFELSFGFQLVIIVVSWVLCAGGDHD
jgi:hypothetical protein